MLLSLGFKRVQGWECKPNSNRVPEANQLVTLNKPLGAPRTYLDAVASVYISYISVCISCISNLTSTGAFTNSVQKRLYICKKFYNSTGTLALASLTSGYWIQKCLLFNFSGVYVCHTHWAHPVLRRFFKVHNLRCVYIWKRGKDVKWVKTQLSICC
jgi:hypothetical protein